MDRIVMCDCGHPPSVCGEHVPGYGEFDGKTYCYACCAERDKQYMSENGVIDLYLVPEYTQNVCSGSSEKGTRGSGKLCAVKITNRSGSLVFNTHWCKIGYHCCFGGRTTRIDAWFVFDGFIWHAVQRGDNNMIARCRRTKTQWVLKYPGKPEYGYTTRILRNEKARIK